jgi:hypothetical protein
MSADKLLKLGLVVMALIAATSLRALGAPPLAIDGQPSLPFLKSSDFTQGKLRGFELGDTSNRDRPNDRYFTDLVATGANLGRVWVQLRRCKGCSDYTLDDAQIGNMDFYVSKARANKFWLVFLVTTNGDEREGDLWRDPALQKSLAGSWRQIADRYKDIPEIAGYDILNEPITPGQARAPWLKLATDITQAIRSVDTKHVVIVEPTPGAEPFAFINLEPIKDSNLVYSVHMYHPHEFTHQGVNKTYARKDIEYPSKADSPIGAWDKTRLSQDLQPVRDFSKKTGIPIYVGEFSVVRWAPAGSRDRYIADLISLFEAEKWPWTYHAWRGWPGWDPENESQESDMAASKRNNQSSAMNVIRPYFSSNRK